MTNNLEIFKNEEFGEVRTINENGKIMFCGSDVAKALGYIDTAKAIKQHCREDGRVNYPVIDNLGRTQQAKFINEGNLYRLIASSKLESAQKFESWVFDEVLPSIRKHGVYLTDPKIEEILLSPDTIIKLATDLKKEKEERQKLQVAYNEMKPMADLGEAIYASDSCILVGDLAKVLCQKGIDIGPNRLFEWLREKEYLCKKEGEMYNVPTQKSIVQDLIYLKETPYFLPDGKRKINKVSMVTPKGQKKFIEMFLEQKKYDEKKKQLLEQLGIFDMKGETI